jgi:hypothetical protein
MTTGAVDRSGGRLPFRFGWNEWTGSIGDLGTFVPIFLGLAALNGLPPSRALFLVGAVYIAAAFVFRLPIPVQPLKAMAAIAIAGGAGMEEISAAGIWMGAILLLLALTGLTGRLSRLFGRPIVKGIQLGVGLMLIRTGVGLFGEGVPAVPDPGSVPFSLPSAGVFLAVLPALVLPQLPLTLGNAVYAVSDVARDYFGRRAERASPRNLALSLGVANLVIGAAGGLPVCHGSGGLTAHYGFGSRSGGATVIAGGLFILAAIFFALAGTLLFEFIPSWALGAMLLYVGTAHARLVRGLEEHRPVAWAMGAVGLMTGNLFHALVLGLFLEAVIRIAGAERRDRGRPAPSVGDIAPRAHGGGAGGGSLGG